MTEAQEDKIIEFTQDFYKYRISEHNNFVLERYVDYDDKFPEYALEEIFSAANPNTVFIETVSQWDCDSDDWQYQDDFWSKLEDFCEEENKDVDEDSEEYLDFDEAKDYVIDTFQWTYPAEFLNPEFTIKVELTSDYADEDFIRKNVSMKETDGDNYEYLELFVTVSLEEAIKIAEKEVTTVTFKKGTYCNFQISYENDGYPYTDYAEGELNKDITVKCKNIYDVNYEDKYTDSERVILKESNIIKKSIREKKSIDRKFESINRSKKSWDSVRITDYNTKRILKNCGLPEDYLSPKNKYVEFDGMGEFGRGYVDWILVFEVNVADMIRTNKYLKDSNVTKTLKNLIDSYYEEYCDKRDSDISLLDDPEEFKKAKKYVINVFNTEERILIRMRVKDKEIQAVLEDNVGYGFDSFPGKQLDLSYKFYDRDNMYIQYFEAVKDYIDKNF